MSALPKHTVGDPKSLITWARNAMPGEFVVYHAGSLVVDRQHDTVLNTLADTVHVLQETGFLSATQKRYYLLIVDVWAYVATRTGRGYAPAGLMSRKITSHEWRALKAIRDRDADISAIRAIRDAVSACLASSDDIATGIFDGLRDKKLVTEAPGKGWTLSPAGVRAMT